MPVFRFFRPTREDSELTERVRAIIKLSRELLEQPLPDTFLGRQNREPFPLPDQEE